MIIGIVAGAMIAVILVILLLLWLKSTGDRTYKNDHGDKCGPYGGQGPNTALLGGAGGGGGSNTGTNSSQMHHHHHLQTNGATVGGSAGVGGGGGSINGSGSMRTGDKAGGGQMSGVGGNLQLQKPKKRDSKDIKEWYV